MAEGAGRVERGGAVEGGAEKAHGVRLVVARCEVTYTGRLNAYLPDAIRLLVFKAGWKKNGGERNTRETGLAKWFTTDHAVASALDAIQIHGAYGYSNEYPVERYLRDALSLALRLRLHRFA